MCKPKGAEEPDHLGDFTFYFDSGRYFFTCWNVSHTTCGVHSVSADQLGGNIVALERNGYVNRNGYIWNYRSRQWDAKIVRTGDNDNDAQNQS